MGAVEGRLGGLVVEFGPPGGSGKMFRQYWVIWRQAKRASYVLYGDRQGVQARRRSEDTRARKRDEDTPWW